MLWNWYTVDSCFIARSWQVTSKGAFAGSCVGVVFLVIALELLRRLQREFDGYLHRVNTSAANACCAGEGSDVGSNKGLEVNIPIVRGSGVGRLKVWQQLARAALFMVQFAVGYFVMLLAMYYNGTFVSLLQCPVLILSMDRLHHHLYLHRSIPRRSHLSMGHVLRRSWVSVTLRSSHGTSLTYNSSAVRRHETLAVIDVHHACRFRTKSSPSSFETRQTVGSGGVEVVILLVSM